MLRSSSAAGGPGSIGLLAVAQALALAAEEVLYVDTNPARRAIAEGYGAQTLDHVPDRLTPLPITVDASEVARVFRWLSEA